MTDLENIRALLEKLEIPYITSRVGDLLSISIREMPKITFTFFKDGEASSIYNEW